MSQLRCSACGEFVSTRTVFEDEGECPHCGADAGSLVELDAYDDPVLELRCAECGWEIAAGIEIEWDDDVRVFTVDDDCPICAAAGASGQVLEPADGIARREEPEFGVARAAARRVREETLGPGLPVDVDQIANKLGLTVRRGPFRHDGLLTGEVIEVPEGHPGAERFVIAHEIGHYELRHQGSREKVEPEANAFASELLIPRAELVAEVKKNPSLRWLAGRFAVSKQALVYAARSAKVIGQLRS